ncbi:hypothetical protein U1Q18_007238 [Sarracenia purpurea var. burkii]
MWKKGFEKVIHHLRDCGFAKEVWGDQLVLMNWPDSEGKDDFITWSIKVFAQAFVDNMALFWVVNLLIWSARNILVARLEDTTRRGKRLCLSNRVSTGLPLSDAATARSELVFVALKSDEGNLSHIGNLIKDAREAMRSFPACICSQRGIAVANGLAKLAISRKQHHTWLCDFPLNISHIVDFTETAPYLAVRLSFEH